MEIQFNLFTTAVVILLFCLQWWWLRRAPAAKQPPGPTGLPIVGNLLQLGKKPHQTMANWAKHYGPLMTLRFGLVTTIVASSAELAKEILQTHDKTFSDRPVPDVIAAQPYPEGTLAWVPGNQTWRNRRRVCTTQLFTNKTLDTMQHLRHKKVGDLLGHVRKLCASGEPVDIGQVAFATTLNLISITILSVDVIDPDFESAQEFKDLVWRIMEDGGKPNLSDYFPVLKWFDLQGIRHHIKPSYKRLHEIFDEIVSQRLKSRALGLGAGDFLEVLLDQCEKDESDFNSLTIKPLILDLFIAGSDTSSITTEWAMAELLRSPDTMKKLQNELIQKIGSNRSVKESDIDHLPYLQAVVKETMRLHPAAPLLLPYKAGTDVEIGSFTIYKDNHVVVNAWSIGRDELYWDNPLVFKPERFLGSDMDFKGQDFQYIPFGAGRRICPGLPLGFRMVYLMLASLVHEFNWKIAGGIAPENLDMEEQFGITLKKAIPLTVIPMMKKME
ncbi:geraniol 8-hydroxylase-like [Cornus florida]|uniref:geraniol 8-hydroxylase-like n=1 Tax=Cornus florida TaxID=4283 RepID=UPI0028A246E2|nr:geraniol 8-hydroxylase-like [Cornus florida]